MRSVRAARRLRVLCLVLTCFVVAFGVLGVLGGIALAAFHEVSTTIDTSNPTLAVRTTSFPYVLPGVGLAIGSAFVALFLLAVIELFRMRAAEVIEFGSGSRASRRGRAAAEAPAQAPLPVVPVRQPMSAPVVAVAAPPPAPAAPVVAAPSVAPPPPAAAPSTGPTGTRAAVPPARTEPPGRRVRILTDDEKARLAAQPPSSSDPGWYPDPLAAAQLRRWNGTNWTGEQQPLAVPRA